MQVLDFAKPLNVRKETVDVPELGGAVVVRGLLASEAFAVTVYRQQALQRLRAEAAERKLAAHAAAGQPSDAQAPADAPPPGADPNLADQLTFDELVLYGRYQSHLLACAVTVASGAPLWNAQQWEAFEQHHPGAYARLLHVAERLSALNAEQAEKN